MPDPDSPSVLPVHDSVVGNIARSRADLRPAAARHGARPGPFARFGLPERLVLAAVFTGLVWSAIAWAMT